MPATAPTRHRKQRPVKSAAPAAVVYAISDSTGNLARHMLTAFLTQFPAGAFVVRYEAFVSTDARLTGVLNRARDERAVVCHALIDPALKARVADVCREAGLGCRDLTGGVVEFLSTHTGVRPRTDAGALHRLDESYQQRIAALEFTLGHDDGLGADTLCDADIVLVGVSRTSKTPTSIYLAQQGYRVANVSLAMAVTPPRELLAVPPGRVVALTINPEQLVAIRTRRESAWRMKDTPYGDPDYVAREVAWARRLYREQGWPVLDVTDQAIEETAAWIVSRLPARGTPEDGENVESGGRGA